MRQLTFLGTGNGMPHQSSCSSVFVEDDQNNILLDTGGGYDLIRNLFALKKDPTSIQNIFISHWDSDHILGIVPLIRIFHRDPLQRTRTIYCSRNVKKAIDSLLTYVANDHYVPTLPLLNFVIVKDGDTYTNHDWTFSFFDVRAEKTPQFGAMITFSDGKTLGFLGDEPLRDHELSLITGAEILIHEAFCLEKDAQRFEPHPKSHSTVKEAAENATKAGVKRLALIHMEDETLATRKETYTAEAKEYFSGDIFVPVDLDQFEF